MIYRCSALKRTQHKYTNINDRINDTLINKHCTLGNSTMEQNILHMNIVIQRSKTKKQTIKRNLPLPWHTKMVDQTSQYRAA